MLCECYYKVIYVVILYQYILCLYKGQINFVFRFSGIIVEDMDGVIIIIRDVQVVLFSLFIEKMIFIGYSLESDFVVVKVILNFMIFIF